MASAAEERIRLKAEAALRDAYPDARIVHELMLRQGGCRIDLAAIRPNRLIVVEIKSEKDVLDRLATQLEQAATVADGVFAVIAEKHLAKARELIGYGRPLAGEDDLPRFLAMYERNVLAATTNAPDRLAMLWASELRRVAETSAKTARTESIIRGSDFFTGQEVRTRVCAALRARPFPRADPPILSDLFPAPSVGSF